MGTFTRGAALLWLVLFASCVAPIQLPSEFAAQRASGGEFLAATADEAVLRVRDVDDPTMGSNAQFWVAARRNDFVEQRGYVEVAKGEVADSAGVMGQWIEFTANVRGERVEYLAAMWSRQGGFLGLGSAYVQVVEFAARGAAYAARVEAVKAALMTVAK